MRLAMSMCRHGRAAAQVHVFVLSISIHFAPFEGQYFTEFFGLYFAVKNMLQHLYYLFELVGCFGRIM